MKINPTDQQQWVNKTHGTKSTQSVQTGNFGKILDKTLHPTQSSPCITPGNKIAGPILDRIQQPAFDEKQVVYGRLDRILGTFEQYQLLLADQHSSLKDVSHAMDLLKGEARDLQGALKTVADGDPLKSILDETLAAVSKEIFQFESGAYVD